MSAHGLGRVPALIPVVVATFAFQACGNGSAHAQAPDPCTLLTSAQATKDLAEPVTCKRTVGTIPFSTVGTYGARGTTPPPLVVDILAGPNRDSSLSSWQRTRIDAHDAYWTTQPGGHVIYMVAQTRMWVVSIQLTGPEPTEATAEAGMTTLLQRLVL